MTDVAQVESSQPTVATEAQKRASLKATWTQINDSAHPWYNSGFVITGDPNLYGRVYIGANGRSIIYGEGTSVS